MYVNILINKAWKLAALRSARCSDSSRRGAAGSAGKCNSVRSAYTCLWWCLQYELCRLSPADTAPALIHSAYAYLINVTQREKCLASRRVRISVKVTLSDRAHAPLRQCATVRTWFPILRTLDACYEGKASFRDEFGNLALLPMQLCAFTLHCPTSLEHLAYFPFGRNWRDDQPVWSRGLKWSRFKKRKVNYCQKMYGNSMKL